MAKPKKILLVRFSSIGDIVLTTPVIRCLSQQLDVEIHFLTKRAYTAVLEANPYIDRLFTIDHKIEEILPELKAEQYDLVVDLHKNLRTSKLKWKLGVKSVAFDKLNLEKWLIVNFKINRLPDKHIVDRNLETVASLGIQNDGKGLDYFIPPDQEIDLNSYFSNHLSQEGKISPIDADGAAAYVAFVIGAAHNTKRLPIEKIISICSKSPRTIVLLGGPEEAAEGTAISAKAGRHVINSCGKLKLNQSASVVRQAWKVISHDTGLMHIAAAYQKPIISIWGNTIPEFGMYPYYPEGINQNLTIQVEGLGCRPCSKIGFDECPKKHFRCMEEIDEARILEALNTVA